jgi:hypothetical protein
MTVMSEKNSDAMPEGFVRMPTGPVLGNNRPGSLTLSGKVEKWN